jgi:hypothetical protein
MNSDIARTAGLDDEVKATIQQICARSDMEPQGGAPAEQFSQAIHEEPADATGTEAHQGDLVSIRDKIAPWVETHAEQISQASHRELVDDADMEAHHEQDHVPVGVEMEPRVTACVDQLNKDNDQETVHVRDVEVESNPLMIEQQDSQETILRQLVQLTTCSP